MGDVDDKTPKYTIVHFSFSNAVGEGQGDVAALLRKVAEGIEAYGDIWVQDITFHSAVTDAEDDLTMTVYYVDEPRPR